MNSKLYVVLNENERISLKTREEIDASIKNAEENLGNLPFTTLGNIDPSIEGVPYLFICTYPKSVFYEVVKGSSLEDAKEKLASKKRLQGKHWKIVKTLDLTELIDSYTK